MVNALSGNFPARPTPSNDAAPARPRPQQTPQRPQPPQHVQDRRAALEAWRQIMEQWRSGLVNGQPTREDIQTLRQLRADWRAQYLPTRPLPDRPMGGFVEDQRPQNALQQYSKARGLGNF